MLNIRAVEESELGALLELYRHLHTNAESLSLELATLRWHELSAVRGHFLLGAFSDEKLVSSCVLSIVPSLARAGWPYGLVENVVTLPAHRRQGIGRALLLEALSIAWSAKCYKVMLFSGRQDEAIGAFYGSAGFRSNEKQAFVARPEA